jgi:hypothetical protein
MGFIEIMGWVSFGIGLWLGYEIWRAPMVQETEDGKVIQIKPTKKLRDLFKKKK